MKDSYIAIDFDGTVVTHDYPDVGQELPGAVDTIKKLVAAGHKIILNTMRCDKPLEDAVKWFRDRDIPLYGANCNPDQLSWTSSPKIYRQCYIDDAALGCPLIYPNYAKSHADFCEVSGLPVIYPVHSRPYVNWIEVGIRLERAGYFTNENNIEEIIGK